MNPADFLTLAKELSVGSRETDWRSAVSRAYYAAFHASLAMATQCGLKLGKSSAAHDKLAMCLQASGNAEVATAGTQLKTLRDGRNIADYDLRSTHFQSPKMAASQVAIAEDIMATVDGMDSDKTVRDALRAYARDILGLIVVGND